MDTYLKLQLKEEIKRDGIPPVKAIMVDIHENGIRAEESDARIIQEIANSYL
jgi:hypothetical protein